jgi:AcrR family transcriptional regulator
MAAGETDVAQSFRARLLDGLATSLATRGYRDTTVADIVRNAKTSKRTFYDQFASKEECFVDLLRTNNTQLITRIRAAIDPDADWDQQVRSAVRAYVAHIAAQPAVTLSWIREAPALGEAAQPLHRLAMGELTDMVVDLSNGRGFQRADLPPISRPVALILLGGFRELTALLVEDGRDVDELTEPATTAALAILGGARCPSAQHQPG